MLDYIPQTLPVLQEAAALVLAENELPPAIFDAKVEIILFTCWL